MKLERTTSVYGHSFELNVAVECGRNWNDTAPAYKHFCMINLSTDDLEEAKTKAHTIKASMGDKYKCTLRAIPKVAFHTEEVVI